MTAATHAATQTKRPRFAGGPSRSLKDTMPSHRLWDTAAQELLTRFLRSRRLPLPRQPSRETTRRAATAPVANHASASRRRTDGCDRAPRVVRARLSPRAGRFRSIPDTCLCVGKLRHVGPGFGEQEVRGHAWVETRFRSRAGIRPDDAVAACVPTAEGSGPRQGLSRECCCSWSSLRPAPQLAASSPRLRRFGAPPSSSRNHIVGLTRR